MGAPKVSRAILTMSMARTTPAQKPRGLSSKTSSDWGRPARLPFGMESRTVVSLCQYTNGRTEEIADVNREMPRAKAPPVSAGPTEVLHVRFWTGDQPDATAIPHQAALPILIPVLANKPR